MPPNSWRAAHRWCWSVTTTSCQLQKDIYPTRSLDNNALIQPESRCSILRVCWLKAGPMPCGSQDPERAALDILGLQILERWQKDKGM